MMPWTIEQTATIDAATRKAAFDVIDAFNDAATGRPEPSRPLAVLVRDDEGKAQGDKAQGDKASGGKGPVGRVPGGKVLGGAWAVSYYDWLYIDLLYLPDSLRRQGWGGRIMRAIEREAVRRGCVGIWVDTMTFQAPLFYPRFGYTVFAEIKDYVGGHDHLWFFKTALSGGPVDAGLDIDSDPDPADREALDEPLGAFNDAIVGPANRSRLGLLLREGEGGPVVGGLLGRVGRGWLFVELLVLPEAARGQGIGTRLMAMAEAEAAALGCRGIWLDTFSWQAQPFYERLGFHALGTLPNYPGPHTRTLLAKRLGAGPVPA